jgi:hypothetical protein
MDVEVGMLGSQIMPSSKGLCRKCSALEENSERSYSGIRVALDEFRV